MAKPPSPGAVPADTSKWSESSRRSVSAEWIKEYTAFTYKCWRCGESSVFSAEDQRYTYEVKKANINQQRILCEACWRRLQAIDAQLGELNDSWATSKQEMKSNRSQLQRWLQLLNERDQYVPYKADVAKKNMLVMLLRDA
ncbi:zinc-ribbon domain containing protein [Ideonella sp. DXS29W]|uniref:Zinc-ribbon domain containing protein n=1 Tax=Ideonella lacteola TaxID=2984193 RepID=A0ABU9BYG8_9BURK